MFDDIAQYLVKVHSPLLTKRPSSPSIKGLKTIDLILCVKKVLGTIYKEKPPSPNIFKHRQTWPACLLV